MRPSRTVTESARLPSARQARASGVAYIRHRQIATRQEKAPGKTFWLCLGDFTTGQRAERWLDIPFRRTMYIYDVRSPPNSEWVRRGCVSFCATTRTRHRFTQDDGIVSCGLDSRPCRRRSVAAGVFRLGSAYVDKSAVLVISCGDSNNDDWVAKITLSSQSHGIPGAS